MIIKELNKKQAEVKLYGNIGSWFADGNSFTALLEDCEARGYKDLTIRMHCYGGSVFEGNVMYNAMQRSKLNITIIIDGVAASMGLYVLPAIAEVHIVENGFGMAHRPAAVEGGDADAHLACAKLLQDMENNFLKTLTERTNLTAEDIKAKWFDGKDHWLNADEMIKYGFAKKKIPATAKSIQVLDSEITQELTAESMYNRFAACLDINSDNNKNEIQMKQLLINALGLVGVTAESTDAEIVAAAKKQKEDQATALTNLQAEATAKATATIKTMLDTAKVPEGALRTSYEAVGLAQGVDTLATILGAKSGVVTPMASYIVPEVKTTLDGGAVVTHGAGASAVKQDWNWYQANDPEALAKLPAEQFNALYKAEYGVDPA
ncbi:Clp protease ClpP [Dysgonomonas sp. ZJ279]|uniref:Clp protease ClpP n=1 Tax=Dysgonomonas sp. ZJ279 TaxID=2709796 RepID=UPI0021074ED5|nr:Clp protease ClpP [Dysgonomonas sp. ZJ279]